MRRTQDFMDGFLPRGAGGNGDGGLAQVNRAGCLLEIHLLEDVSHAPRAGLGPPPSAGCCSKVAKRCVDDTSDAIADLRRSVRLP